VRSAWAKFWELAPILTSRGDSLKVKGKVYRTCVQRVSGSETWPMRSEGMQKLVRAGRLMCGVSFNNRISRKELSERMVVVYVADVVRQ